MSVRDISISNKLSMLSLVYLSTLYSFTNHVLLFSVIFIIINVGRLKLNSNNQMSFVIILVISVISIGNNFWYTSVSGNAPSLPFLPLMILSFFIVQFFDERIMKWLLWLIVIEIFIAAIEYILGVSSIFKNNPNYFEFSNEALYYRKVAGLSDSSSVLSYKVMTGLFITHFINVNKNYKKTLYIIMIAGIIFSFNRTVIVSSLLFLIVINYRYIKSFASKPLVFISIIFLLCLSGILIFPMASEYLMLQFARGDVSKGVDLSSRSYIWIEYWKLISQSPFFGSGSYKTFVTIPEVGYEGHPFHAHNSFLMLLSTQGVFISILMGVLILINMNRKNIIYIVAIFIYSMAQYGVFWGVSFLDIMLFCFLFNSIFKTERI